MTAYYDEYTKVLVSVDCIIFGFDEGELRVLIGRRKMSPGCGQWSLYGGFVQGMESIDDAATRVLRQLTGIHDVFMRQVGAFGNVSRDPGERVISIAYYALINVNDYDAKQRERYRVEWVSANALPQLYSDHNLMVAKALSMMQEDISREPISFNLLPELFTLPQLQRLYEAIWGEKIDKRNFRKRIKEMDCIEKTGLIGKAESGRRAFLYRFNKKAYKRGLNFKL